MHIGHIVMCSDKAESRLDNKTRRNLLPLTYEQIINMTTAIRYRVQEECHTYRRSISSGFSVMCCLQQRLYSEQLQQAPAPVLRREGDLLVVILSVFCLFFEMKNYNQENRTLIATVNVSLHV